MTFALIFASVYSRSTVEAVLLGRTRMPLIHKQI